MSGTVHKLASIILLAVVGCAGGSRAQSGDPKDIHTFTGPNGTTLEAEVLDFVDRTVIIRRLSDGRQFDLAANRLAPADVDFMRAWLAARKAATHPLGWKRLRIHLPEFADEAEAPGIPAAFRRIDLRTWEAELPEGAWVAVQLLRQPGNDFAPQFLLPFSGEREWFLSYEDARLYRAIDPDGGKILAGLAILPSDGERELRAMKKEIPPGGVALYSGFVDEDDFAHLGGGVHSMVVRKLRSFSVARGAKIRAVRVTETVNEFEGLAGFDELEFLEAPRSGDFPLATLASLKGLATLVADGDLDLKSAPDGKVFPALRHLSLRGSEIIDPAAFPAFVSQVDKLQCLSLPDEQPLQLGALPACGELTAIEMGDACRDPGAEGLGALKNLTTVLLNADYAPADFQSLVQSDSLAKTRTLRTSHAVIFEKLPMLKQLILEGNRGGIDPARIATPATVTHLQIRGASDQDIRDLGGAGASSFARFLSLHLLNCSRLDPLKSLPRVEFLSLRDQYVTSEQKLTALDLSPFSHLRGLGMIQLQNLNELTLSANSQLEAISIRACGELLEIQSPPIRSLREVAIANCGALESIGEIADADDEGAIRRFTGTPRLK